MKPTDFATGGIVTGTPLLDLRDPPPAVIPLGKWDYDGPAIRICLEPPPSAFAWINGDPVLLNPFRIERTKK